MKKIFEFGKVDYLQHGREDCPVTVSVELRDTEKGAEFSASGNIYNCRKSDICFGGQCLDTIAEFINDDTFNEIYKFWKLYHLNGMHAGTPQQENAIHNAIENGILKEYDYKKACEYLQSINLYEVMHEGKPYKYGHGWLFQAIPENDLNRIKELLQ